MGELGKVREENPEGDESGMQDSNPQGGGAQQLSSGPAQKQPQPALKRPSRSPGAAHPTPPKAPYPTPSTSRTLSTLPPPPTKVCTAQPPVKTATLIQSSSSGTSGPGTPLVEQPLPGAQQAPQDRRARSPRKPSCHGVDVTAIRASPGEGGRALPMSASEGSDNTSGLMSSAFTRLSRKSITRNVSFADQAAGMGSEPLQRRSASPTSQALAGPRGQRERRPSKLGREAGHSGVWPAAPMQLQLALQCISSAGYDEAGSAVDDGQEEQKEGPGGEPQQQLEGCKRVRGAADAAVAPEVGADAGPVAPAGTAILPEWGQDVQAAGSAEAWGSMSAVLPCRPATSSK